MVFSGIVAYFIINRGYNALIIREILSLENGDGFELILSYDDENDEPWKTAQIRKRICGVEADELLDVESGKILFYAIKKAKENKDAKRRNNCIKKDKWPLGIDPRSRYYDRIKEYLEKNYSLFERVRGQGVRWIGSTAIVKLEEPTITPIETTTVSNIDTNILSVSNHYGNYAFLQDNRPVTPNKLWKAGCRTYEQSKADGGRFQMLHVEERIMPFFRSDEKRTKGSVLPINITTEDSKDELSLRDAIASKRGNLYLIGEGGIGKTTAMFSIIEQSYKGNAYDPTVEIPLFVELNRAPGIFGRWYKGSEGMKSCFLRMEIARQLLDCEELANVPDELVQCVTDQFKTKPDNGQPQYLLLLDGLNEVSMNYVTDNSTIVDGQGISEFVRRLIIEEINYLITKCPNVRIMLTSRTDETEVNCTEHGIEKLYLTGLKKKSIRDYLTSRNYTKDDVKAILENDDLMECIKIPLFLTMYANLRNFYGVTSRGEILKQFFYERGENIAYSQQEAIRNLKFDKYHLWFMLDFLLPAIASEMERTGKFELNAKKIGSIIEPILKGWKPTHDNSVPTGDGQPYDASIIGEYGKACFDKYTSGRYTIETVAEQILVQGKNMVKVAEYVMNCAVDFLHLLYRDRNEYGFIHHHFRDFFAATHDINLLKIALEAFDKEPPMALESLASFCSNANHQSKSIFIGEILGEHHNKPYLKDNVWHYNVPSGKNDRNLLKRALEIFRGKFEERVGYGVYNLIEILKIVRQDLYGSDLSSLDLTRISLNGVFLGHTKNGGANLQESKISMKNLICQWYNSSVNCVAIAPDAKTFITGSGDKTIKEWCRFTGECIRTYFGHYDIVRSVCYAPDGKTFLSGADDNTIREWDIETGECIHIYKGHNGPVFSLDCSLNDNTFISGSRDGKIKEWDRFTGQCIHTYLGHYTPIRSISYAPDCNSFISGAEDGTVKEWDKTTKQCVCSYKGHNDVLRCVSYAPNGKTFISGAMDNTIKEWDRKTGQCIRTYIGHSGSVYSISYSPDGKKIISGAWDNTIKEWENTTGKCIRTYIGHSWSVNAVAYLPDGNTFISGSGDRTVKEWNISNGQCVHTYNTRLNPISTESGSSSSDCKILISDSSENTVIKTDSTTTENKRTYKIHHWSICFIAYAADGNTIISQSCDNVVKEWAIATGQCIRTYYGNKKWENSFSNAPNGETFISISNDNTIKVLNKTSGQFIRAYVGQYDFIICISYSPDGKTFLTGGADGTVRIWSTETGKCQKVFYNYPGLIVLGCDLRNLHSDSLFSDEDKDILREYGAIVD